MIRCKNFLYKYLINHKITVGSFARRLNSTYNSVYGLLYQSKPNINNLLDASLALKLDPKIIMKHFGYAKKYNQLKPVNRFLYKLRVSAGLSQNQLANRMNVSQNAVSKFEVGTSFDYKYDILLKYASLFNLSLLKMMHKYTNRFSQLQIDSPAYLLLRIKEISKKDRAGLENLLDYPSSKLTSIINYQKRDDGIQHLQTLNVLLNTLSKLDPSINTNNLESNLMHRYLHRYCKAHNIDKHSLLYKFVALKFEHRINESKLAKELSVSRQSVSDDLHNFNHIQPYLKKRVRDAVDKIQVNSKFADSIAL